MELFSLKNKNGLVARFTEYGARWVSMLVPDRNGIVDDILLGFDTLPGYCNAGEKYHGAIVGRVCGRIRNACFTLSGTTYNLASNDAYGDPVKNHLHGGITAFHNQTWMAKQFVDKNGDEGITFYLKSIDGDEGYPGNLRVNVTYILTADNVLRMICEAETDKPTPVNITNHAFFNLQNSRQSKSTLSHLLMLNSSNVIECDRELIPTGHILPVDGSFSDFRISKTLSESLLNATPEVKKNKGFSIGFVLDKTENELDFAARLEDQESGRRMDLYTNQSSLQVYTGYFMDGTDIGHNQERYYANAGIALEPQGYPDAPNQPDFPSIIIDREHPYFHHSEYRFSTVDNNYYI